MTSSKIQSPESRAAKIVREVFESGRPLTYIRTSEEERAARVLREVATRLFPDRPAPIWTWSLTQGMRRDGEEAGAGALSARAALEFIAGHNGPGIFHLKDFHEPLRESSEIRRLMRDLYEIKLNGLESLIRPLCPRGG